MRQRVEAAKLAAQRAQTAARSSSKVGSDAAFASLATSALGSLLLGRPDASAAPSVASSTTTTSVASTTTAASIAAALAATSTATPTPTPTLKSTVPPAATATSTKTAVATPTEAESIAELQLALHDAGLDKLAEQFRTTTMEEFITITPDQVQIFGFC